MTSAYDLDPCSGERRRTDAGHLLDWRTLPTHPHHRHRRRGAPAHDALAVAPPCTSFGCCIAHCSVEALSEERRRRTMRCSGRSTARRSFAADLSVGRTQAARVGREVIMRLADFRKRPGNAEKAQGDPEV